MITYYLGPYITDLELPKKTEYGRFAVAYGLPFFRVNLDRVQPSPRTKAISRTIRYWRVAQMPTVIDGNHRRRSGTSAALGGYLRQQFPELWRADELALTKNGTRVRVGGSVICRQRPGTAKGVVFVSLEDETGIANAILYADIFEENRITVTQNPALILEGPVQIQDGVIHVKVERIDALRTSSLPAQASHDFH